MKNAINNFKESLLLFKSDKKIIFLSLFPLMIGICLYYFLGAWVYSDLLISGKEWIEATITQSQWGNIFYYLFLAILTVVLYFFISWTFVLIVSLIAAPFNDLICGRVLKLMNPLRVEIDFSFKRLLLIFLNEFKKISVILILTILALALSIVPILVPISIMLSAILMASSFLDYSWCRDELNLSSCIKNIRTQFLGNVFSGALFLFLMTVPVVNLVMLPFGVIYYSRLYALKDQKLDLAQ